MQYLDQVLPTLLSILPIIFSVMQFKQGQRMEQYEKSQKIYDDARHAQEVEAKAASFISRYDQERRLIPLCAIASMYDRSKNYSRNIYREYCSCTSEIQNSILKACGLDLRVRSIDKFYEVCLGKLTQMLEKTFPSDKKIFYDNGKYFQFCLERCGSESLSYLEYEYEDRLTDILSYAFRNADSFVTPISTACREFNFAKCSDREACQFVTTIARYSAIYYRSDEILTLENSFGSPEWDEGIQTMEDLFLIALFNIYVYLVLVK